MGKPNQVIPKAGLQPIPAFDEPFSRIIINCVGPLPKTKPGNEYLFTIMCVSTRFPEAIPLRNIKTKTLVKFFTFVGLPKSVQSDQGSRARIGRPQTSSSPSPPVIFIAGRPKAALLFWFFGDFKCGALLFMVIHVIYKYKYR